jgi:RNA polymerase sigma-70 factor (ECF subfamily)
MSGLPFEDTRSMVGRLYDAHGAALYRYALMVLADSGDAEDAVQQVFTSLLRLQRIPDAPDAYLRRAVRNECYSRLRRRQRPAVDTGDATLLEGVAAADVPLDERLALEHALRALPPEQREVVHLHVYEGWVFREIADLAGVSINTVAARYRYALSALRRVLATVSPGDP